jgi:hypothetical protein
MSDNYSISFSDILFSIYIFYDKFKNANEKENAKVVIIKVENYINKNRNILIRNGINIQKLNNIFTEKNWNEMKTNPDMSMELKIRDILTESYLESNKFKSYYPLSQKLFEPLSYIDVRTKKENRRKISSI